MTTAFDWRNRAALLRIAATRREAEAKPQWGGGFTDVSEFDWYGPVPTPEIA